ncbi:hypothetical protein ACWZHB_12445 [Nocardia sp. FBN12]|uniref:hypothetical protein n=1 Tax=Nocardia sp. FBN12 TaxID=3419766 RepID=UPI003CFEE91D
MAIGLYMRLNIDETPVFKAAPQATKPAGRHCATCAANNLVKSRSAPERWWRYSLSSS